jgi:acyl-CoA synthetase (AMP-forming)/AMP-acid ligase II
VIDTWGIRPIPQELRARYIAEGYWTDDSLGSMVDKGLRDADARGFRVNSKVHPFRGTLGDINRAARSLATSLQQRGVGPGSVVLLQMPNWAEAGIAFWAATYLGAVVVPVVHFYGAREVAYILGAVQPDVVVIPEAFGANRHVDLYAELPKAPNWLVVGDTAPLPTGATRFADLLDAPPLAAPLPVDPDAPALIGFTSGTTSNPKGVVHSHRTLGFEARQLNGMFPNLGPPQITGAPVGHFIGMLNAFVTPMMRETPVTLIDVWDPGEVLRMMVEDDLAAGGGATYFLTSLLDHPDFTDKHVAQMPFAGLGGSTVPLAVTQRAEALGIQVYRSYGSTEHPSITGAFLTDPVEKRMATDGHVLAGVEIRLDPETGEISSRGPDCCIGYTDPELTARVFDGDGWYHTGDVGVLDDDGYLTITDRVSDIIIRGGENISAQEIEELMLGLPQIAEIAVVAAPDARLGEHAAAVMRLRDPSGDAPSLADVRAHLEASGLTKQNWPESLHVVAEFPRTPSGKVQKFRLRQQLRDGELPSP